MSIIGLNIKLVELRPYSELWKVVYEKERSRLFKELGDFAMDIQHIGSTAVPNLIAKPVIDIAIGVKSIRNFNECTKLLEKSGYVYVERRSDKRMLLLFRKTTGQVGTHYVHVSKYQGKKWRQEIFFRDYLISHPREAKSYGLLKLRLAKEHASNREQYTLSKKTYIRSIFAKLLRA